MKLQRFFGAKAIEDRQPYIIPSLELIHQLKSVFRLAKGDRVILFDNSGYDFIAVIDSFDKEGVSFSILEKRENNVRPKRETYLFASIVKRDTFEWIVEKATELGVAHIVPIISDRTEKQGLNRTRLTKVSIEASEQSGRSTVPEIHDILKLADSIANYSYLESIVWEPSAEKFKKEEFAGAEAMGVYIGPEGGWTERELEMFKKAGMKICSLGPQVLRAETAVIAVLSRLVF